MCEKCDSRNTEHMTRTQPATSIQRHVILRDTCYAKRLRPGSCARKRRRVPAPAGSLHRADDLCLPLRASTLQEQFRLLVVFNLPPPLTAHWYFPKSTPLSSTFAFVALGDLGLDSAFPTQAKLQ